MTLTKISILGIGLIGLIALGLYGIGKKSVYAEATIPASPQSVWAVLTELERYPEWNPAFFFCCWRLGQRRANEVPVCPR